MSLRSTITPSFDFLRSGPGAIEITPELAEEIQDAYHSVESVVSIRPFDADYNLEQYGLAESLLTHVHRVETRWAGLKNATPPFGMEFYYDDNRELLQFRITTHEETQRHTLLNELTSHYPDAEIGVMPPSFMPVPEGWSAAGCRLKLRNPDFRVPWKNYKDHAAWFKARDPYSSVTSQMTGVDGIAPTTHCLVQTVVRPAPSSASLPWRNWYRGVFAGPQKSWKNLQSSGQIDWGEAARDIAEPFRDTPNEVLDIPAGKQSRESRAQRSKKQRGLGRFTKEGDGESGVSRNSIMRCRGEQGFEFNIRIVAVGEDADEARQRVKNTANAYASFYDTEAQQGFRPVWIYGRDLRDLLLRAAGRELVDHGMKTGTTTGASVLRATPLVETRHADYTLSRVVGNVPPRTSRFKEWDQITAELPDTAFERFTDPDLEWPYAHEPTEAQPEHMDRGREVMVERAESDREPWDEEGVFGGLWPNAMMENVLLDSVDEMDQPIFLGTDSNGRPVPIERSEETQHIMGTGFTGQGKSTTKNRIETFLFNCGYGGVTVDPGGEDTFKLLMSLHPDRLEDVVVMDVGSNYTDYRVGINLLDTFANPGDAGFEDEVEAKLSAVLPLLETDDYARMKGISEHIFRGLIEANFLDELPLNEAGEIDPAALDADIRGDVDLDLLAAVNDFFNADSERPNANFTIEDARTILRTQANREAWHQLVVEHGLDHLEPYARTLAEMDDDDDKLEPLLRRLRKWLESPLIRGFASLRQSTVNLPRAIVDGKIIILKTDSASQELAQIVSGTVCRFVWNTFLLMPSDKEMRRMELEGIEPPGPLTHDDAQTIPPFLLSIDELAAVITESMDLDRMLSEGRKRGLRVMAWTQQYRQLTSDQQDALSNTGRLIAFNPGNNPTEARAVANRFPGIEQDDVSSLDPYHAITMGEDREPFEAQMFAPTAPRRGFDDAHEFLLENEREHGVEVGDEDPLGAPERFESTGGAHELLPGSGGGGSATAPRPESSASASGSQSEAEADSGMSVEGGTDAATLAYKAFYDTALEEDREAVTVEEAADRLRWYLNQPDAHSGDLNDLVDRLTTGYLSDERRDGEIRHRVDGAILGEVRSAGTGSSTGDEDHHWAQRRAYEILAAVGAHPWIPSQGGSESDFRAELPVPEFDAANPAERDQALATFREEYPELAALTHEGVGIYGEVEKSTGRTQPAQTCWNFAGAIQEGLACLFVVLEGESEFEGDAQRVARTMADPPLVKRQTAGEVHYYMDGTLQTDEGTPLWRPRTDANTSWYQPQSTGGEDPEIVLSNTEGREFARFTVAEIRDGPTEAPGECRAAPKDEIDTEQWQAVSRPFVPEAEGLGEIDDLEDYWEILILPDDDTDREPSLYRDGECIPLQDIPSETTSRETDDAETGLDIEIDPL